MKRVRGLGWPTRVLLVGCVAGVAFGVATVVQAAIPDSTGVIAGCYQASPSNTSKGVLRVINAENGEQCRFNENPLSIASTDYVQNVVTSTINSSSFMIRASGVVAGPNNFKGNFFCGTGYISTENTWGATDNTDASNITLQTLSSYNVGEVTIGTPNEFGEFYGHFSAPSISLTIQGTCVDGRAFGLAGPVAPIAKAEVQAKATMSIVK